VTGGRRERLPLLYTLEPVGDGWLVRVPVRVEEVTVTRELAVRERAVVRRRRPWRTSLPTARTRMVRPGRGRASR